MFVHVDTGEEEAGQGVHLCHVALDTEVVVIVAVPVQLAVVPRLQHLDLKLLHEMRGEGHLRGVGAGA